jgi:C-terminal processing protease CtpA/Prc
MKMRRIITLSKTVQKCMPILIAAILLITLTISCNKSDNTSDESENPNREINDWILKNMHTYYLWNTQIPQKTDKTLSPDKYFESLLYRPTDRFSWIQDNFTELINSLSGVNTEAGYDFNLLRLSNTSSDIIGYITYIKPGTPAESAGLKRGNFFRKINDIPLTVDNSSSLVKETSKPHTLGMAVISETSITSAGSVSLSVIENYPENPVLIDTVYRISNRNIGYFVYNFFARDKGNGSLAYEMDLNDIFGKFKSEQIDELIVDLRYNGGGTAITAVALAKMISGRSTKEVFYTTEYNDILHKYFAASEGPNYNISYFIDRIEDRGKISVPINSLSGLSTVYFIVSGRSASASETLISGLKPYMNVVLVGGTTYGKNVGSIPIYETNPVKQQTNKWIMLPIISKTSNSKGFSEYENGFAPDRKIYEYEELVSENFVMKQLGDTGELLLKTTINRILGRDTKVAATKHTGSQAIVIGSSADRTPARQNQYIFLNDIASGYLNEK